MNIIAQDKWDTMTWLLCQGETQREVARRVGVNRETVMLTARALGERRTISDAMRRHHERRRSLAAKDRPND
jgi:transposase